MTKRKLLLIILDGVPLRNARRLFGNLEGWVESGEALTFTMRAVLPSTSASCYASIHTGVTPQIHGCTGNNHVSRLSHPDIFSEVRNEGGVTGAVAHSFWSEFFCRAPFDPVRDLEYDEPANPAINHGRFYTMTGYYADNQMLPCDADLFALLTRLCQTHDLDYGLFHSCTMDSMGHVFGQDGPNMDKACFIQDEMLAPYIQQWREMGYEIIVTSDHGQDGRGHHGGTDPLQREFALYYFGTARPVAKRLTRPLWQVQLAPTILSLMGIKPPASMTTKPFLAG